MNQRLALVLLAPLLALVPLVAWVRFTWNIFANPAKAWELALGFDRLGNAALNGNSRETISSRAARSRDEGSAWGCILCKLLDSLQPNHCNNSKGV
jgi:hypothetical protein